MSRMYNHQCPVCKKKFDTSMNENWAYKIKYEKKGKTYTYLDTFDSYFCSWPCMRKYEQAHTSKLEQKRQDIIYKELNGIKVKGRHY